MIFQFRFAAPYILFFTIPFVCIIFILRFCWYKEPTYQYTLVDFLSVQKLTNTKKHVIMHLFSGIRSLLLISLALLCAKPQWGDTTHPVTFNGIDIIIALDVSGSMHTCDFEDDRRSRLEIAKAEAIRFIEKRTNDAIGLVIFGSDALSRCPLTLDKVMLRSIINDLHIGIIDYNATVLARAIITGANRLKHTENSSKVMILLTDGEPSGNDASIEDALAIAQTLGIKIYTIGIGSDEPKTMQHGFFMIPYAGVNKELLTKIAQTTGGRYFCARSTTDMRAIYDDIDALEKSEHEAPIFTQWYDIYLVPVSICFLLVVISIFLSTAIWFVLL